jgi:hypothetical protein
MTTILNLVESQAGNIGEGYLLIFNFLCETWPKVIGGGKFNSEADLN